MFEYDITAFFMVIWHSFIGIKSRRDELNFLYCSIHYFDFAVYFRLTCIQNGDTRIQNDTLLLEEMSDVRGQCDV